MDNNFKLNKNNIGNTVELKGWVKKSRRLGELVFFDLRKEEEVVQVVVDSKSKFYEIAKKLRSEYVVSLKGKVVKRKEKNNNIPSGEIEIILSDLVIINESLQTPLIILDETDALEQKRMEYRYLDLRRNLNQKMLKQRSNFNKLIREYFYSNNFIEVETPIITKPTPGGAGEFKIISENHKGKYYSLVQSPQIYKQLLMYSGVSKYFQIAKCFRDEDSRADRQLEFTQLDCELSFTNQEEIIDLTNNLINKIIKNFGYEEINKFIKIKYIDAINNYGTDKPDLRFGNEIYDLTNILKETPIKFISDSILNNKKVKGIFFEGNLSNSEIKKIDETIKSQGSSGLSWIKINNNEISGSLKLLSNKNIDNIKSEMNIKNNGTIFFIIDENLKSLEYAGRIRLLVAEKLNLIDENKLSFLWVIDFPMFEKTDEGKIDSLHNPFTSVKEEHLKEFKEILPSDENNVLKLLSNSYDIVLNGTEIGGGSIRFSNSENQRKSFEIIGMSKKVIDENFGWLLEAQNYGVPTHGGIALGLDRILSILLKKNSIRDVIAFPKSSNGLDDMMKAPIKLKEVK